MRRLDRYILREVVLSWLAVTSVLLIILLTNQVAAVLERAADNQYPRSAVLTLIGLSTVQNLPIVVPIGLLLGVVLALGRLYHESEMTAAQACGVGLGRIYVPITGLALVVTALLAWLTLDLAPQASAHAYALRSEALRSGQFSPVVPGHFRSFGGGGVVIYAERAAPDGTLERVFIERTRGEVLEVALAQRARHDISADGMLHTITLFDGERYEGIPGTSRFRIVRFAEQVVPVRLPDVAPGRQRVEAVPTKRLWSSGKLAERAELHWRVALPLMAITLTLLAVPLSRLRPRQGRYARVWLAVLIYFLYSNLASAGRVWIERGVLPEWLGLWWVHVVLVAIGMIVMAVPRVTARLRYRG